MPCAFPKRLLTTTIPEIGCDSLRKETDCVNANLFTNSFIFDRDLLHVKLDCNRLNRPFVSVLLGGTRASIVATRLSITRRCLFRSEAKETQIQFHDTQAKRRAIDRDLGPRPPRRPDRDTSFPKENSRRPADVCFNDPGRDCHPYQIHWAGF